MSLSRKLRAGLSVVALLLLSGAPARADAEAADLEAPLEFVEEGVSLRISLDTQRHEVRFKQEPAYGGRDIVRGAIPMGKNRANFVGFAWDRSSRLLYVDSNRNLDLTDETPVPQSAAKSMFWSPFDVALTLEHEGISIPYVITLRLAEHGFNYMEVKSGWQGTVTLDGTAYTILVGDNLDGVLGEGDHFSLRPAREPAAAEVDDPFAFLDEGSDHFPRYLAILEKAYQLDAAFETTPAGTAVRLRLLRPDTALGRMEIAGGHDGKMAFMLGTAAFIAFPGGQSSFQAPIGTYKLAQVEMPGGWRLDRARGQTLTVREGEATQVPVGGPLREVVSVTRSGNALLLGYSVMGAGDMEYSRPADHMNPPRFAVYRGDRRVGGGAFEYG
jgi:hypothetical protein